MEEEKQQKELFDFEPTKKPFPRISNMLPKPDFDGRISLTFTLDRIIFSLIVIIMLVVVVYALGVERGRSLTGKVPDTAVRRMAPDARTARVPQAAVQPQFISTAPIAKEGAAATARVSAPIAARTARPAVPAAIDTRESMQYIVLITFSKAGSAQTEAGKLKIGGFDASVIFSDPYYLVCVGPYPSKTGGQGMIDFKKLRSKYKDAYFKTR